MAPLKQSRTEPGAITPESQPGRPGSVTSHPLGAANPTVPSIADVVKTPPTAEAQKDAERQLWFQNAVQKRLELPSGYVEVAVLVIRWCERLDDFNKDHGLEISNLQTLFEERFHYKCRVVELDNDKKPQNQLNHEISAHIREYDGPHNLLIVYYTGHGTVCGEDENEYVELAASNNLDKKGGKYKPTAEWGPAEYHLLHTAEGHVLTIFDCCFASNLAKHSSSETRLYELLAASPKNEMTPGPGKRSFTNALIKALEKLLNDYKGQDFTTVKLVSTINSRKKIPAMRWERLHTDQYIKLSPLDRDDARRRQESFQRRAPEKASLTIKFSLETDELAQEQIELFGHHLGTACQEAKMKVRQIDWVDMKPSLPRTSRFKATVMAVQVGSWFRRNSSAPKRPRVDTSAGPVTRKRTRTNESMLSPHTLRRPSDSVSPSSEVMEPSAPPTPMSEVPPSSGEYEGYSN